MSWTGTVTCGYCGATGHNRRSCPTFKVYCENNPDSWAAKRHSQSAAKGKVRRCSYCNLKRHNRRSCETLKTDKTTYVTKAAEWRTGFAEWVAEIGLTPGALVKVHSAFDQTQVQIVAGYSWGALNHEAQSDRYPHQAVVVRKLTDPAGVRFDSTRTERLPQHDKLVPHNESLSCEVVAPVYSTPEAVLAIAPGWFAGGSTPRDLNDVFDSDRKASKWYENQFEE